MSKDCEVESKIIFLPKRDLICCKRLLKSLMKMAMELHAEDSACYFNKLLS